MPRLHCPACNVSLKPKGERTNRTPKCPKCGGELQGVLRASRPPTGTPTHPPDISGTTPAGARLRQEEPEGSLLVRLRNLLLPLAIVASLVWVGVGLRRVWITGHFPWSDFFLLLGGLLAIWVPSMLLGTGTPGDFTTLNDVRQMSNRQRAQLGFGVSIVAAVCCVSPVSLLITFGMGNARFNDYARDRSDLEPAGKALGSKAPGKLLPVDRNGKKVHWAVYWKLSRQIKPADLDEIRAIAWLEWESVKVGEYAPRGVAFKRRCRITVINEATREIIAEQTLWGGEPPEAITGTVGIGSEVDDDAIAGYLNRLPLD